MVVGKGFLSFVCLCALAVILVGGIGNTAHAQQTNNPQMACTPSILSLSPCVPYLMPPPNNFSVSPTQSCCNALATVLNSNAQCICLLFQRNNPLGVFFNKTQAISLPTSCNVRPPFAVSQCLANMNVTPATPPFSPVSTPVPSPEAPQGNPGTNVNSPPPSPGNGGSNSGPAGGNAGQGGTNATSTSPAPPAGQGKVISNSAAKSECAFAVLILTALLFLCQQ